MSKDVKLQLGSSIVYNWYSEFETLFQYYSDYVVYLIEASIDEESDNNVNIKDASDQMRKFIIQNYLRSVSIFDSLNIDMDKDVTNIYNKISGKSKNTELILRREDVEGYISLMQKHILKDSLMKLVNNSSAILEDLYGDTATGDTTDTGNDNR